MSFTEDNNWLSECGYYDNYIFYCQLNINFSTNDRLCYNLIKKCSLTNSFTFSHVSCALVQSHSTPQTGAILDVHVAQCSCLTYRNCSFIHDLPSPRRQTLLSLTWRLFWLLWALFLWQPRNIRVISPVFTLRLDYLGFCHLSLRSEIGFDYATSSDWI